MITDLVPEHPNDYSNSGSSNSNYNNSYNNNYNDSYNNSWAVQVVQAADQEQAIQAAEVITETTAEDLTEIILGKTMINKSCEIRERIK